MKRLVPLPLALVLIGCSGGDPPIKDSGAPQTTYHMVPATTGGGATQPGGGPPAPAPLTSKPVNPPSAGSD